MRVKLSIKHPTTNKAYIQNEEYSSNYKISVDLAISGLSSVAATCGFSKNIPSVSS